MISVPTIVKVGGSLYDLPDLGPRLSAWLATQTDNVILVPGGGPMVETIRQLDRTRHLGEEACHWLALRMLTINAHFLAHLLPDATIISDPKQRPAGAVSIMDMCPFTLADEARPGRLPHSWAVSSDSLAMRVAIMAEARHLVLLKSTGNPQQMLARETSLPGSIVDDYFHKVIRQAPGDLLIQLLNLRAWTQIAPNPEETPLPIQA